MEQRGKAVDRHGREWTARVVRGAEAADADFRFWYEELTPEQRVEAVEECLLGALKAKGMDEIPRLRRVARVVRHPGAAKRSASREQDGADPEHPGGRGEEILLRAPAKGLSRAFELLADLPNDFFPEGSQDTPPREREDVGKCEP